MGHSELSMESPIASHTSRAYQRSSLGCEPVLKMITAARGIPIPLLRFHRQKAHHGLARGAGLGGANSFVRSAFSDCLCLSRKAKVRKDVWEIRAAQDKTPMMLSYVSIISRPPGMRPVPASTVTEKSLRSEALTTPIRLSKTWPLCRSTGLTSV